MDSRLLDIQSQNMQCINDIVKDYKDGSIDIGFFKLLIDEIEKELI